LDLKPCVEYNKSVFVDGFDPTNSYVSEDTHVNFCIHGTKIYSLSEDNSCRSGFSLKLSDDKLNVVKIDGKTKIDDLTTKIDDIQNYILVDCVRGVCRQTQGYLKNNNIVNAFVGTKGGDSSENLLNFFSKIFLINNLLIKNEIFF